MKLQIAQPANRSFKQTDTYPPVANVPRENVAFKLLDSISRVKYRIYSQRYKSVFAGPIRASELVSEEIGVQHGDAGEGSGDQERYPQE